MKNPSDYDKIIAELCLDQAIALTAIGDGWTKILEKQDQRHFIVGYNIGLNNATSSGLACSKSATHQILHLADVPSVEHQIIYSPDNSENYAEGRNSLALIEKFWHQHDHSIVLKPDGSMAGRRVYRITSLDKIAPAAQQILSLDYWHEVTPAVAMCPFYEIQHEYRVIMLDGEAKLLYQKTISPTSEWKFNLSQGAKADKINDHSLIDQLIAIAQAAVRVLGLRFCSVDIIKTTTDDLLVLEVNSGVSVNAYLAQHPDDYDQVKEIFREALGKIFA